MTEQPPQPQSPQPSLQAIVEEQQKHINETTSRLVWTNALLAETRAEAMRELSITDQEVARLNGVLSQILGAAESKPLSKKAIQQILDGGAADADAETPPLD